MLRAKPRKCEGCGLEKRIWSKNKCLDCCRTQAKPLSNSTQLKTTRKGKDKKIVSFYAELQEKYSNGAFSIESGIPIGSVGSVNMAHILPKSEYVDVATDTFNIVILTWKEHTRFDELLGRHEFNKLEGEFPNSWPEICRRLRSMIPNLKKQGTLSKALKTYLDDL